MNTFPTNTQRPHFVSTFLSHSSTDKPLVEAVAKRLGRRGVFAWLDRNELSMGPLDIALRQAVQEQKTITIFLSEASLASSWCTDELRWAIEAKEGCDHLLPIYLGDPLPLVRSHSLLRTRFLHPDGDRVNQNGYFNRNDPANPDPDAVAEAIAQTVYRRAIPEAWSEIAVVLDQRGDGQRLEPILPANITNIQMPVLTFRPSLEPRQQRELLVGVDWEDMAQAMTKSLSSALGTIRGDLRKVRVLGHAQTGLVWAVGKHFNRTTSAELYAYDRDGIAITNKGQIRHTPLSGGDPHRAIRLDNLSIHQSKAALGVGSKERYAQAVKKTVPDIPLFWVESGYITESEEAMKLIADIVASVERLHQDHEIQELVLFWTTANHVALLAAANLASHIIPTIRFMEWDHARNEYVYLPMPDTL